MVIFGKFVTLSIVFDDINMKFHISGGSNAMMAGLYEHSSKALKLMFESTLKLTGSFGRIYLEDKKVTVEMKLNLRDGIIKTLVEDYKDKNIRIDYKADLLAEKAKPVNRRFLTVCAVRVKKFSTITGHTIDEMKIILNEKFSELTGIDFDMDVAQEDELEAFYSYLGNLLRGKGEDVPIHEVVPGGQDGYLQNCRAENKCCHCGIIAYKIEGKYPLCRKHWDEFNAMRKAYRKTYLERYAERYHF